MIEKILITGINGFVGSHLADVLVSQNKNVHGIVRRHSAGYDLDNIAHLTEEKHITLHEADMTSFSSVEQVIAKVAPDVIYHLAAQSFVPTSWADPNGVMQNNVQSTLNLLQAVRALKEINPGYNPIIQLACSSEQYGFVHSDELPITESNPFRPMSTYAVTKIACEMLGYQYAQSFGLRTIITRAFNHEGARRGQDFVISSFAKQIVDQEYHGNKTGKLKVGNLEAKRDFTHVRDTVKAYILLADAMDKEAIRPGEAFNIATGEAHTMQEVVDELSKLAKIQIEVEQDPDRMRPSDVPVLLGDATKLRKLTGWKPTKTFNDILRDTLEYWRTH